jgi:hypothetical protein
MRVRYGSGPAEGASGLHVADIIFCIALATKVGLCLGPQEGATATLLQRCCCQPGFRPLPGHARQLQQLLQAALWLLLVLLGFGRPLFSAVTWLVVACLLVLSGYFNADPAFIAAGCELWLSVHSSSLPPPVALPAQPNCQPSTVHHPCPTAMIPVVARLPDRRTD